ncbi:MAG: PAS domain-containing protein [Bacteroidia bacterium]|nr:PAS domain-containing protein [Bacteroidia bacterium]
MNNSTIRILILDTNEVNSGNVRQAILRSSIPAHVTSSGDVQTAPDGLPLASWDVLVLSSGFSAACGETLRAELLGCARLGKVLYIDEAFAQHPTPEPQIWSEATVISSEDVNPTVMRLATSGMLKYQRVLAAVEHREAAPAGKTSLPESETRTVPSVGTHTPPGLQNDVPDLLIDASQDVAMLLDNSGRIVFSNVAGITLFHRDPDTFSGRNLLDVLPKDTAHSCRLHLEKARETGEVVSFEVVFNGHVYEAHFTPLWETADPARRIAFFAHDITERSLASHIIENEERKLRGILDNSPDGIILVDERGVLVEWSPAMARITGLRADDVLGRKCWDVHWELSLDEIRTPELLLELEQWLQGILQSPEEDWIGKPYSVWTELNDGRRRHLELVAFPVVSQHGRLLAAICRDTTSLKLAELEFRRKSDELHTLLRVIPDMVYFKDREGRYRICNQAICDFFGRNPADVIGKTDAQLLPAEFAEQIHHADVSVLQSGKSFHLEDVQSPGTPECRYFDTIKVPLRDKDGDIIGLVGISRDVTEQRKADNALRESERIHRDLIAAFPDMLFIFDADLTIIDYHLEDEQKQQFEQSGTRGRILRERVPGPDGAMLEDFIRRFQAGGSVDHLEFRLGPPFFTRMTELEARLRRVGPNIVALVRDISEEKENRRMLEEQNIILTERNNELDAFTHSVAHDLKNPLSLIIGYAELINEESGDLSVEELREFADSILFNAKKMITIINALLLLASVRKEDVTMQTLDMLAIVHDAVRRLRKLIADRQASLTYPEEWPDVKGYAPWIEEVWVNYLSNSLKYGGSPCVVELGFDDTDDGVCFWVRDNGAGIPADKLDNLFKPFTRLSDLDVEGHGLGLSIVGRIIAKLGGKVYAESLPQGGSLFSFTLPKA